jgi:hypothetical protein
MRPVAAIGALVMAVHAACAEAGPSSPECRQALDALEAQEAQAASAPDRGAALKRVEPARKQAARACLGGTGDVPPPSVHDTPPLQGVPGAPARAVMPPPPRPVAPPVVVPPRPVAPTIVTGCDAAGCWTNDGSRVQRLGPGFMSPRGLCTGAGPIVQCP